MGEEQKKKVFRFSWGKPKKMKLKNFIEDSIIHHGDTELIPLPMNASGRKMPELWDLTTNFKITTYLLEELEKVDGVEILVVNSPYNMCIGIGKLFDEDEVRLNIQKTLRETIKN